MNPSPMKLGRHADPSDSILDSLSVQTTDNASERRIDGRKKVLSVIV